MIRYGTTMDVGQIDPPRATADLIVRLTGNLIDKATPGTTLVGVKVLLHKKDGRWLIKDAAGSRIRPGP
jgi:hypothetical protein